MSLKKLLEIIKHKFMSAWLKKILNLVKQTGDRVVVTDLEGNDVFVVMSLDEYSRLQGVDLEDTSAAATNSVGDLTEDQLLTRINGEIATWKSGQNGEESLITGDNSPIVSSQETTEQSSEGATGAKDDRFYFEPVDESK